ncbi:MAG TPA: phage holin family protein [Acidimicrobiales bacterium]
METPGTDEPSPSDPSAAPLPPPSAAPRPATGPTTSGIPVEPAPQGGLGGDWPKQATDAIVNLVDSVRDRTTGPIGTVARGLVFGVFAGVLGIVVGVMAIIATVRLLDEILPSGVWLPYLILGLVFVLAGALVFRKRNQPAAPAGNTGSP